MSLYNWKPSMLGDKEVKSMAKRNTKQNVHELQEEINTLNNQAEELRVQIYQLQLEKDVLETATEIIKKDQGISLQTLTNKKKP